MRRVCKKLAASSFRRHFSSQNLDDETLTFERFVQQIKLQKIESTSYKNIRTRENFWMNDVIAKKIKKKGIYYSKSINHPHETQTLKQKLEANFKKGIRIAKLF